MRQKLIFFLSAVLLLPLPLAAQMLPFSVAVDARVGLVTPTGDFASSSDGFASESGVGYAIGGSVYPIRSLGFFAGYQRSDFGCEQCALLGLDDSALVEGLEGGVHLSLPLGDSPISPWFRAGVINQTLAFSLGDDAISSEPTIGFTGGAGVTIPLSRGLELNPAARYFQLPAEFEFGLTNLPSRSIDVAAYSFDVGLSFRF